MTTDLQKAKEILQNGNHTCVLIKDDTIYTSDNRGVKPLLMYLEDKTDLCGFCAADKVVGRAAAFLYVLIGIKELYAAVISKSALDVLESHGIETSYGMLVDAIRNRTNTGFCPMEQATLNINNPHEALKAVKMTLEKLKG